MAAPIAAVSFLDAGFARIRDPSDCGTMSGPDHWNTFISSITTSQSSGSPSAARSRGWTGTRAPVDELDMAMTETM